MDLNYSLYEDTWTGKHISHADLVAANKETSGDYLARAENSGSEGCYVEVARWNYGTDRWERYCFVKVFGGECGKVGGASAEETAEKLAREIDPYKRALIHRWLPSWEVNRTGVHNARTVWSS